MLPANQLLRLSKSRKNALSRSRRIFFAPGKKLADLQTGLRIAPACPAQQVVNFESFGPGKGFVFQGGVKRRIHELSCVISGSCFEKSC